VEPPKSRYFSAVGSSSVKTVANRHGLVAYHNKPCNELLRCINTDDLEFP